MLQDFETVSEYCSFHTGRCQQLNNFLKVNASDTVISRPFCICIVCVLSTCFVSITTTFVPLCSQLSLLHDKDWDWLLFSLTCGRCFSKLANSAGCLKRTWFINADVEYDFVEASCAPRDTVMLQILFIAFDSSPIFLIKHQSHNVFLHHEWWNWL